ncbi:MAG: hypothetical protein H0W18_00310 [Acidobacteria bacterium]|nr:hypothetical protein [Acidobacteriota bacterium]
MSAALGCTTRAEQQYPEATFVRSVLGPVTRAAAALRQQNAAGRYAESRAVAEKALADKLETMPMRRLLYQLGELQGDADLARRQIDWATNHARSFDISGARGQVAFFQGRVNDARKHSQKR